MEVVRLSSQEQGKLENVYTSSNNRGDLVRQRGERQWFIDVGKRALEIIDPRPGRIHPFGFAHTPPSTSITQPALHDPSMIGMISIDTGVEAESIRRWVNAESFV